MDMLTFLRSPFHIRHLVKDNQDKIKDKNMDDKKDKNLHSEPSGGDENNQKSVVNTGFFKYLGTSDSNFIFQYKKTEKILAALYLVTNFLSAQEPLRWQLREIGLNLLSNVMSLKDALPSQKDELCNAIKSSVFEMISLLEIAHFAGFISSMNFEILKKEFIFLLDSVSNTKQSLESFVLPNNFFTDDLPEQSIGSQSAQNFFGTKTIKDKNISATNGAKNAQNSIPTKRQNPKKLDGERGRVEIKKTSRQEVIISLLKKKKEIMVKDVSAVVSDCSEKTLQRELLYMVSQGILKKEGERRWSKYSLA